MDRATHQEKGAQDGHPAHLSHDSRVATVPLSGRRMAPRHDTGCQAKTLDKPKRQSRAKAGRASVAGADDVGFPALRFASGEVLVIRPEHLSVLARLFGEFGAREVVA